MTVVKHVLLVTNLKTQRSEERQKEQMRERERRPKTRPDETREEYNICNDCFERVWFIVQLESYPLEMICNDVLLDLHCFKGVFLAQETKTLL